MPVQFGIFDHIEMRHGLPVEQIYENRIALLKRAEEGGFYGFHLAEHHGNPLSATPTAAVFLAALAQETTRLKLIPTVVCLPLHHPVRLFEDLAMLDALSHGRLEIGVGKGVTAFEHLQFGHPPEEASARADDTLRMLLSAWETGIMSSEGSPFYDFLEFQLPFDRIQLPYPPLWTAGNVERAGTRGHNLILPGLVTPELRGRYNQLRGESRKQPGHHNPHIEQPWVSQCQSVVIADTDQEAKAIGRRAHQAFFESVQRAGGRVPPHMQTGLPTWQEHNADPALFDVDPVEAEQVVAGTVEHVRDYYVRAAEKGLANYFMLTLPFGDLTEEEAWRTLEGFITEVIPAVREVEAATAPA